MRVLWNNPYFQSAYHAIRSMTYCRLSEGIVFFEQCGDASIECVVFHNQKASSIEELSKSKVAIILHSVGGDCYEFPALVDRLVTAGFIVFTYSRQGHGKSTGACINPVGSSKVLDHMIHKAAAMSDSNKVNIVAFSAGTSLLARYLGHARATAHHIVETPIMVSAGFRFEHTMRKLSMLASILCYFRMLLTYRRHVVATKPSPIYLIEYMSRQLGFKTMDEYFRKYDPVHYMDKIKHRCIFVNSEDDFVFPIDTVRESIECIKQKHDVVLTKNGGHISFYREWGQCWLYVFIIATLRKGYKDSHQLNTNLIN